MATVIKAVKRPHPCMNEINRETKDMGLQPGSIVECSCGLRYTLRDDQRDGLYWAETNTAPDLTS